MTNKTVLITGAAQRIGAVIVRDLHAQGMDVIIHYHNSATQAQSLAEELNADRAGSACFIQADLLDDSDRNSLIRDACNFKNRLNVLINNASSFYPTALEDTTIKQWDELVGINMKAPFFLSQQAAPYLRACAGCIVNITDILEGSFCLQRSQGGPENADSGIGEGTRTGSACQCCLTGRHSLAADYG